MVLIPSGTNTGKVFSQKPTNGDGDFDFTRSTAATRVNADGNIEKQTGNYILYSQQIDNGYWDKYQMSVTANQATAPDGTTTADLIDDGTASSLHAIEENETIGFGGSVTASIHAKYVDTQYLVLAIYDTGYKSVAFDIQNGTIGNKTFSFLIPTIEDLGNGWYRCAVTYAENTRSNPFYAFGLRDDNVAAFYTSAGSNRQAYVWGAQLEDGLVARDYIETTTAAVEGGITDNVPRLDYTDSSCPALLLEPLRTNGIAYSEYFDSYWADDGQYDNITITHNATASPEGLQNATKIVGNNTSNAPQSAYIGKPSVVASQPYVSSVFAKAGEYDYIVLVIGSYNAGFWASFNLDTGVVDTAPTAADTTASIEDYGNGWYRCMIYTTNTGGAEGIYITPSVDGTNTTQYTNTTNGVYIYGAQVEAGSYATSYIPTYGTSVTRNADKVDGQENASLFNDSEGVLYVEFSALSDTRDNEFRFLISDGSNAQRIQIGLQTNNNLYANSIVGGGSQAVINHTLPNPSSNHKIAFKYKANDFALYVDGVIVGTDINGTTPTGLDIFDFYRTANNNNLVEANVRKTLYFPTALSNTDLEILTGTYYESYSAMAAALNYTVYE